MTVTPTVSKKQGTILNLSILKFWSRNVKIPIPGLGLNSWPREKRGIMNYKVAEN